MTPSPENMRIAEELANEIYLIQNLAEWTRRIAKALQAKDDAAKAEEQILVEGLKIALDSLKSYQDRTGQTLDDTLNGKWTNPPAEINKLQDGAITSENLQSEQSNKEQDVAITSNDAPEPWLNDKYALNKG